MASPIIEVADAVVSLINSTAYSQSVSAVRTYRVDLELQDLVAIKVLVVPRGIEQALEARSLILSDIQIDIGIHKKVSSLSNTVLDSMMGLVEEVGISLRTSQPYAGFGWVSTENVPIYSPDLLDQAKEFLSILTVTFRALEDR
jgi:hypothetical protein